jgi:hypothetical protein
VDAQFLRGFVFDAARRQGLAVWEDHPTRCQWIRLSDPGPGCQWIRRDPAGRSAGAAAAAPPDRVGEATTLLEMSN